MSHDLVIFDCDGVLVDSERLAVVIEARLLTEYGLPHTPDDVVRRFLGRTAESVFAEIEAQIGADLTRRLDEESTRAVHEAFERELAAVPGIGEVISTLHAHDVATCVASSGSHAKMRTTLGLTGLFGLFDGNIFSGTEVEHGKPAPDLFLHAAQRMRTPPVRCAVVEDSVYGVRGAVAAGMHAFGFAGGLIPADALAAAGATVFEEMAELPALLLHSSENIA